MPRIAWRFAAAFALAAACKAGPSPSYLPFAGSIVADVSFDEPQSPLRGGSWSGLNRFGDRSLPLRVAGRSGSGGYFSHASDAVDVGVDVRPVAMPVVSFGGWFFPTTASGVGKRVVVGNVDADPAAARCICIVHGSGSEQAMWGVGALGMTLVSPFPVRPNHWSHVFVSYDMSDLSVRLWVDGRLHSGRLPSTPTFSGQHSTLLLGSSASEDSPHVPGFVGIADSVLVFDKVLTDESVTQIMQAASPPSLPAPSASTAGYALRFEAEKRSYASMAAHRKPWRCMHDFTLSMHVRLSSTGQETTTQWLMSWASKGVGGVRIGMKLERGSFTARPTIQFSGPDLEALETWSPNVALPLQAWHGVTWVWNGTHALLSGNGAAPISARLRRIPEYKAVGCGSERVQVVLGAGQLSSDQPLSGFFSGDVDEVVVIPHSVALPIPMWNTTSWVPAASAWAAQYAFNDGYGLQTQAQCAPAATCLPALELHFEGEGGAAPAWIHSAARVGDWVTAVEDTVTPVRFNASFVHIASERGAQGVLLSPPGAGFLFPPLPGAGECPPVLFGSLVEAANRSKLSQGDVWDLDSLLCYATDLDAQGSSEQVRYAVHVRGESVQSLTPGTVAIHVQEVADPPSWALPKYLRIRLKGLRVDDPDEADGIVVTQEPIRQGAG